MEGHLVIEHKVQHVLL